MGKKAKKKVTDSHNNRTAAISVGVPECNTMKMNHLLDRRPSVHDYHPLASPCSLPDAMLLSEAKAIFRLPQRRTTATSPGHLEGRNEGNGLATAFINESDLEQRALPPLSPVPPRCHLHPHSIPSDRIYTMTERDIRCW